MIRYLSMAALNESVIILQNYRQYRMWEWIFLDYPEYSENADFGVGVMFVKYGVAIYIK